MATDLITAAQREALDKAWDLLSEHFDRILLITDCEVTNAEGGEENETHGFWHGGYLAALGCAEHAKHMISNSRSASNEPRGY
jgi:hypothetical protein